MTSDQIAFALIFLMAGFLAGWFGAWVFGAFKTGVLEEAMQKGKR